MKIVQAALAALLFSLAVPTPVALASGKRGGGNYEARFVGASVDGTRIVTLRRPHDRDECTIEIHDERFTVIGEYTMFADGRWRFRGGAPYPTPPAPLDRINTSSCSAAAEPIATWIGIHGTSPLYSVPASGVIRKDPRRTPWTEVRLRVGGIDLQVYRGKLDGEAQNPLVRALSNRQVTDSDIANGRFDWILVEYNDPFQDRRDCGAIDVSDAPDAVHYHGRRCDREQDSGFVFLLPETLTQTLALQKLIRLPHGKRRAEGLSRYVAAHPGDLNGRALLLDAVWRARLSWPVAKSLMDIPAPDDSGWSPLGPYVTHGADEWLDRTVLLDHDISNDNWRTTDPQGESRKFWSKQKDLLNLRSTDPWCTGSPATTSADRPFIVRWGTDVHPSDNQARNTVNLRLWGSEAFLPHGEGTYPATRYDVDWDNDGIYDDLCVTDDISHTYGQPGVYTIAIRGAFPGMKNGGVMADGRRPTRDGIVSVEQWGNIRWKIMDSAFAGATSLTINAKDTPDLTDVKSMAHMFAGAIGFNSPIQHWDVSQVTDMTGMFYGATQFNQPLEHWDISNVVNLGWMFHGASSFDQPLARWSVGKVTNMTEMFANATAFNQPIGNWKVHNVTNMAGMFRNATAFNQPLAAWDIGRVNTIEGIFTGASAFSKDYFVDLQASWRPRTGPVR